MATFRKKRYRSKNTRINARTYRIKRRGKKSLVRRVYRGGVNQNQKFWVTEIFHPRNLKHLMKK